MQSAPEIERTCSEPAIALRGSDGHFRAMFEGSPIGTALLDLDARYAAVNPALQAMLGYTAAELIGRYVWEQYPDKSSRTSIAYRDTLLSGTAESYRREQHYTRKDGTEICAQVTGALLRDESGRPEFGLCMLEDITERRQLEQRLRQAQKMEALGQFAGGIAHDFNNTLSSISAYAQILFDDLAESDTRRRDAAEILKVTSRAAGLTRQLLSFSRNKILNLDLLDAAAVVDDFKALLRPLLPASINLVIRITDRPVIIRADRTQLEQVLMNLALNARDAMADGGTLTIDIGHEAPKNRTSPATQTGSCSDQYVVLGVSDTGAGIPDEVKCRLFEPFFTTKATAHGTGLGLATVYAIVRQNAGTVSVASQLGVGSCFTVKFPVARGTPAAVAGPCRTVSPVLAESRTTVLIAEDEASVRDAARRLLQRAGMRVLTACNGVQALAILDTEHVDVLMTDMMMPIMGGVELISRATMTWPQLRVIVISGYAEIDESDPHPLGDLVLEKPFSADSLIRAVRDVTTQRTAELG